MDPFNADIVKLHPKLTKVISVIDIFRVIRPNCFLYLLFQMTRYKASAAMALTWGLLLWVVTIAEGSTGYALTALRGEYLT